jgi:hypothetical protein
LDELHEVEATTVEANVDSAAEDEIQEEQHPTLPAETSQEPKKRAKSEKPIRSFPQYAIKDVLQIPKVIATQNAGNPWASEHVASSFIDSGNATFRPSAVNSIVLALLVPVVKP